MPRRRFKINKVLFCINFDANKKIIINLYLPKSSTTIYIYRLGIALQIKYIFSNNLPLPSRMSFYISLSLETQYLDEVPEIASCLHHVKSITLSSFFLSRLSFLSRLYGIYPSKTTSKTPPHLNNNSLFFGHRESRLSFAVPLAIYSLLSLPSFFP